MRHMTFAVAAVGLWLVVCGSSPVLADSFWAAGSPNWNGGGQPGPVIFQLDADTGTVGTLHQYDTWNWIMGMDMHANGFLYVSYLPVGQYSTHIAKVDAATGSIVTSFNPGSYQFNALQSVGNKLYAVENTVGGANRGYLFEFDIDASGELSGGTRKGYIGGAPDGALALHDGTWYASDWKTTNSSKIMTSASVDGPFTEIANTTPALGLVSGWEFAADGSLIALSWENLNVQQINPATGAATALWNLQSQLPSHITMHGALTVVPEPATVALLGLGLAALARKRMKRA